VKLVVDDGVDGPVIFKIVKKEEGEDPEEGLQVVITLAMTPRLD
jgi:hypothetical protein